MRAPTIASTIERRVLVNYHVSPEFLVPLVPEPFRPQVIHGFGIAGICLIRLGHLRPAWLPAGVGITTENAAHRIAVEWDGPNGPEHGVYIPRRDTSSRITALVGGRLFPGEHHRARFRVRESTERIEIVFTSLDGTAHASVKARPASDLPGGSVFGDLTEASAFFRTAPLGYSATRRPDRLDSVELACPSWKIQPLVVESVECSFFDDPEVFPSGAAEFDSALLMRDVPAAWLGHAPLRSAARAAA